jgi:acyl dehydratase
MPSASLDDIKAMVGQALEPSSWVLIDQRRIDQFAQATGDFQFIHVDPERARASAFGGTIAHGLLTLSMLPILAAEVIPYPDGMKLGVNYGYNKIRFVTPVRSGQRIRGRITLAEFKELRAGRWEQIMDATVEIEGEAKPALVAQWITLIEVGMEE